MIFFSFCQLKLLKLTVSGHITYMCNFFFFNFIPTSYVLNYDLKKYKRASFN
jgi:hypothetical protein